jgi:hypothetical protein
MISNQNVTYFTEVQQLTTVIPGASKYDVKGPVPPDQTGHIRRLLDIDIEELRLGAIVVRVQ